METFTNSMKQLLSFYQSLSPIKRAALIFTGVMVTTALIVMGMWAQEGEYVVLWTGVDVAESQEILQTLASKKVPYQTKDNNSTIMVPRAQAAQLRMDLTSAGVTQGGKIIGNELFDKNSFGTTSFVEQINYRRALEGELTKSIKSIAGVEKVRVHLVIPENKTFLMDQKAPSASVILKLAPGKAIQDNNIRGIANLVASAVEGLESENVVIVDSKGQLLTSNDKDPLTKTSNEQQRYKLNLERELETRASTILGRVVGRENIEVRVTTDVDFTKESEVKEQYDPDGSVLLSQVTWTEKFQGNKANPSGIPGSRTNLPGEQNTVEPQGTGHNSDKQQETMNYNVSKKVINTVKPTAQVKKLSVSVLVNSIPVKDKEGKIESYKKREDLKQLEVLAKNAIGYNETRGDAFSIESLQFQQESFDEADNFIREFTKSKLIRDLIWFGLVGTIILLFFFFIIRPFLNWIIDRTSEEQQLPASVEEIESGKAIAAFKEKTLIQLDDKFNPEKAESEALVEKIRMLVGKNPAKAASALRPWINETGGGKDGHKDQY